MVRFLADASLRHAIVTDCVRREAGIDFLSYRPFIVHTDRCGGAAVRLQDFSRRLNLPTQDDVDAGEHQIHLRRGELADPLGEERLVERDNLRNVRHGILGEAC